MEFLPVEVTTLAVLFTVGVVAGTIDAIAGGGGLLTLPALLLSGLPPIAAIATAKFQSTVGTMVAAICYLRTGAVELRPLLLPLICTLIGSVSGVYFLHQIDPELIKNLLPILFLLVAGYFLFSPRVGDMERRQRISRRSFALGAGTTIGFYDGFLGPGTGTFFAVSFVSLLGYSLPRATAATKVLNAASNLIALLLFIYAGQIAWVFGLAMAAGQIIGSTFGAHLALRNGTRMIRPLVVTICLLSVFRFWGGGLFH